MTPPKSAREVAEAIADFVYEYWHGETPTSYDGCESLFDGIKKHLDAFARSARSEALEQCLDIADEHNGCVDIKCLTESNCGATIAMQILTLKQSPGETGHSSERRKKE